MLDLSALTIRYSLNPDASGQELAMTAGPLLQGGLARSLADGIYFYRLDRDRALLELLSFRGLPVSSVQPFQVHAGEPTRHWLLSMSQPTQMQTAAWLDSRIAPLPEFAQNRFETALTIPLTTEGTLAGILTAARLARSEFGAQEATSLLTLQTSLESLLAVAASREENARLKSELQRATDRLAGRKHIERAKSIIQIRHGWTEEEAYLHLRRLSRKTRKPMGEIARGVIVHFTSGRSPRAT
jgi:signal transduction protein with GAF and PtsI domain